MTPSQRARSGLKAAVLIGAVLWVYAPAVQGGRLWDDGTEIFANAMVRSPDGFWKAWTAPSGPDYQPLKTSIEWAQWHLWGDSVLGYHLSSIGLHLLSALLVWRLLSRLEIPWPWFGALCFAVHPMAVPSVAWMAELKNTLSLPLMLMGLMGYMRWEDGAYGLPLRGGALHLKLCYGLSLALFVLALLCKSSVVMLPAVLLLCAWWRRGRVGLRDIVSTAPFFAVSMVMGGVAVWFQAHRAIGGLAVPMGGIAARTARAGMALGAYLLRSAVPVGLKPIYPQWPMDPPSLARWIPCLLIGAAAAVAWSRRRSWGRPVLFGFGYFALNLAPVLGFIPMSYLRIAPVADHLAYVSLAGVTALVAAAIGAFAKSSRGAFRALAFAAAAAAAVLLAASARGYAGTYRDEQSFWSNAVAGNPRSWLAQNNLGQALLQADRPGESLAPLEEAHRLRPDSAESLVNLGEALMRLNRIPEAVDRCEEAVRTEPDFASAHYNLANALVRMGRLPEAIGHYRAAVRIEPDSEDALYNMGIALAQTGALPEAVECLSAAVRLRPDRTEARVNLGNLLAAEGRMPEALAEFEAAVRARPDSPDAQFGLADALEQSGRASEAIAHYEEALRLRPGDSDIAAGLEKARAEMR